MENLQNIMLYLNRINSECSKIEATWTTVLGEDTVNELDGEGVLTATVSRIVGNCTATCDQISQACGMQAAAAEPTEPVELRAYHTAEFFEGEVFDDEGNILDVQAFYCDEYKVHKMLSKTLLEGADNVIVLAQEIIGYYQAGVEGWSAEIGELMLNMVQPILDDISELSDILGQIGSWHVGEADRNINMFMAG